MKLSTWKKLACIFAIVLAPSIAFAGGTQTQDEATTGQSKDPDKGMKEGDMGLQAPGQKKSDDVMVDDATLTTNVEKALKADAMTQNLDIKTKVLNGAVTLTGEVGDARWKARATVVANSVKGVKSVKNDITLGKK